MTWLLDANVLIALGWAAHTHHHAANQWLSGRPFATCPQTQLAFLRISTHPKLPYRAAMSDARATLQTILIKPDHQFWTMDLKPLQVRPEAQSHEQLNDAYLLALARDRNGRLATFDAGIPVLAGADAAFVELLAPPVPSQTAAATRQPTGEAGSN